MQTRNEELERRVRDLEARLAQLEPIIARLQPEAVRAPMHPPAPAPPVASQPPPAPVKPQQPALIVDEDDYQRPAVEQPRAAEIPLAKVATAVAVNRPPVTSWPVETPPAGLSAAAVLPGKKLGYRAPTPPKAAPARSGLEQAIGLKWAGWIGAIVLLIGAALGVKFAYDQGWWQQVSPILRLITMSLGGLTLLGIGDWVYRRVNVIAAASIFGAGVASFFLISYAGNAYYALYSSDSAFVLMGVSTLVGAAVAVRGNLLSIAVLALIGGNIAPLVLRSSNPRIVPFLSYLLMLQVVALFLAWRGRQGKWWTLRALSLATTSLWVGLVISEFDTSGSAHAIVLFICLFAALYHVELIVAALRRNDPVDGMFAIAVTSAYMAGVLAVQSDASHAVRGAWVLGSCAVIAGVALLLRRAEPLRNAASLSASYFLQAGALLVLSVPIVLHGIGVPMGWGIMALAFAVYGRALGLQMARGFAVTCWILSLLAMLLRATLVRLGAVDPVVWMHLEGVALQDTVIIGWMLALIGHALASLNQRSAEVAAEIASRARGRLVKHSGPSLTVLADLVWAVVAIQALPPMGATFSLAVLAWLLAGAELLDRRPRWAVQAMAILGIALVKWCVVDMINDYWSASNSAAWALGQRPVLNPPIALGVLLVVSLVGTYWLWRSRLQLVLSQWSGFELDSRRAWLVSAGALIFVLAFGLSFEVMRVVELQSGGTPVWPPLQLISMGWTILWTAALSAFVALAFYLETPGQGIRWVRIAARLLYLLAIKFLLIDTVAFRLLTGVAPARVGTNLQTLAGLIVVAGLALAWWVGRPREDGQLPDMGLQFGAVVLAALVLLWSGTLEIERASEQLAQNANWPAYLLKQVAWSIYWSVFAILSVAAGFRFRSSGVRFMGLALFGLTLLKVVVVDLSQVGRGYRILSFMCLGVLLLGTSVLYGKLTPRILGDTPERV